MIRLLPVLWSIELPEKMTPAAPGAMERAANPAFVQLASGHLVLVLLPAVVPEPDRVSGGAATAAADVAGGGGSGVGGRRVHRQDVSLAAMGSCWQPPVAHVDVLLFALPEQLHPELEFELELVVELVLVLVLVLGLELEVALATG